MLFVLCTLFFCAEAPKENRQGQAAPGAAGSIIQKCSIKNLIQDRLQSSFARAGRFNTCDTDTNHAKDSESRIKVAAKNKRA